MKPLIYKGNLIEVERAKSFGKSVYVTRINGTGQWVTSTSAGIRRARDIGKAMIDKGEIRTVTDGDTPHCQTCGRQTLQHCVCCQTCAEFPPPKLPPQTHCPKCGSLWFTHGGDGSCDDL